MGRVAICKMATIPEEDANALLEKMSQLSEDGMHKSAEMLGTFLLSSQVDGSPGKLNSLEAFGGLMMKTKEYRRALKYLNEALTARRSSRANRLQSADALLRLKIAQCQVEIGETKQALDTLEAIPARQRTPTANMLLGKLSQHGADRAAVTAYKEVLRVNPWAVEAVIALQELGAWEALDSLRLQDTWQGIGQAQPRAPWLCEVVAAHACTERYEHRDSLQIYAGLQSQFPENLYILLESAKAHLLLDNYHDAAKNYEMARVADECNMAGMDLYASTMIHSAQEVALINLNELSHSMMQVDCNRPEAWSAAALYSDLKGSCEDREQALVFAERAIHLDNHHVCSYVLYGYLALSSGLAEKAITAFRVAYQLRREILVFQGLVEAYLSVGKVKEALTIAKEALQLMKNDPKALYLEGRAKARKAFTNAIAKDKYCTDAVISLVRLDVDEKKPQDALKRLEQHLELENNPSVQCELGELLSKLHKYQEALPHFHTVLAAQPKHERAKRGLDRLQKLIKGLDPDAEEEDEELDEDGVEDEDLDDD